jgi:hypothetical protein
MQQFEKNAEKKLLVCHSEIPGVSFKTNIAQ